jgi:16S rRNA (cytosine967-C5)-methyltransferase
MGTLRMRGAIDREIARASSRPIHEIDPRALQAIRVAAYQVLFLDRVPAHAAVNAAVEDVKGRPRGEGAAKFVNAVLRSVTRGKAGGRVDLSHPDWLVKLFEKSLGVEGVAAFCAANNAAPPFTIRAAGPRADRDALAGLLETEGVKAVPCRFAPQGLTLDKGLHPPGSPSFRKGLWTVQDEAAQLVSIALDPRPGMKILDACAAPGGKTAHIADLMGGNGEVLAMDRSEERLALVRETVKRLGLSSVRTKAADAAAPLPGAPRFDRILVDAPCTGLGTLRRSPEIKWRVKSGDPKALARQQLAILVNLSNI